MIKVVLAVTLGGGFGSLLRFLLQRTITNEYGSSFPTGTMLVNLVGCFAIGIFWGISEKTNLFTEEWRLFLLTGLCGGFTTFSAYSQESITLLREGRLNFFFIYAGSTLILGFILTWLGYSLTK
ncbi:MAG: fluoride efflux transporter CrcB [Chitinophagaceae bacterium]|jgi:CrcB protein